MATKKVTKAKKTVNSNDLSVSPSSMQGSPLGSDITIDSQPLPSLIIDEDGILQSKRYVRNGMQFSTPTEFLQPIINIVGQFEHTELVLTGENKTENANADGSINISYGRLNLVTKFNVTDELFYEVGLLIALDLGQPKIKLYRGAKVRACLNLCIFQKDDVIEFKITDGVSLEMVQTYLTSVAAKISEVNRIVSSMKEIIILPSQLEQIIGHLVVNTKNNNTKNGTSSILSAVDLLLDDKGKYYYKQPNFNLWLLYNACTEYFGGKTAFFDVPEKTRDFYLMLRDLLMNPQTSLSLN